MSLNAVCFGEVLWDVFPDHKKIGGAPLNVAIRLQSFGIDTAIVSRIGNDVNGAILVDYIQENGVSTDYIQNDNEYKTGEVTVFLDEKRSATYDINYPVAWDKIEFTTELQTLLTNADVFIFGSLVCRDNISKETLYQSLKLSKFKVFDVNIRNPHYTQKAILELMNMSNFIKFNDEEIIQICKFNKLSINSIEEQIKSISKFTNTKQICVTRGSNGAVLYINNTFYYNNGIQVKVADTVGAGDSFLATLVSQLLHKEDPQKALDFACAIGAIVASKKGANPKISADDINKVFH